MAMGRMMNGEKPSRRIDGRGAGGDCWDWRHPVPLTVHEASHGIEGR